MVSNEEGANKIINLKKLIAMANVKKKAKVVMLPTNEKAKIGEYLVLNRENKLCIWNTHKMGIQNTLPIQYLHFLSDEEIKKGDWFYYQHFGEGIINQAKETTDLVNLNNPDRYFKKIIATTDEDLGCEVNNKVLVGFLPLPQPSKQFIERYVESYNSGSVIKEVMVEYEQYDFDEEWSEIGGAYETYKERIKINPKDNTITISKCKDTLKDIMSKDPDIRNEVKQIIWNYKDYLNSENETVFGDTDKWIEENL